MGLGNERVCLARTTAFCLVAIMVGAGVASAQEITLDGIVITTTKVEAKAIEELAGVSVTGMDTITDQYQAEGAADFLNSIPGVSTSTTARDPAVAINIRGLQDYGRVNVMIEGARQNFQRSGHNANGVFYIDPEMIKSVDITRGPSATIYGSGAIGGVVMFNLLDADDILKPGQTQGIRLRSMYGTNGDSKLGSATAAFRFGNFDILGQGNFRRDDDYKDGDGNLVPDSGQATDSFMTKARWRFGNGHQLSATAIKFDSDFADRPTDTSTTRRESTVENEQFTLGYRYFNAANKWLDVNARVYRNVTDLAQTRITDSFFEPAGSYRTFNLKTEGFDISNTTRFDLGAQTRVAFTYGADAFWDTVVTNDAVGNGDELTPGGQRRVSGAFAQSKVTFFSAIDLIGAVRYDEYALEGGSTELSGNRVSPKATVGWTPFKGVTLFGTYAEGYRSPAITETLIDGLHPPPATFSLRPNPNLRPEVAKNLEAGVNFSYDNLLSSSDRFRAKVVAFENKVADYIDAIYNPFIGPFGELQYQNRANVTLSGVELEGMYDAGGWFFGVQAQHINGSDDETGEALVTVSPDKLVATFGFRAMEQRLLAGLRGNFYADKTDVADVALHTPSYATLDIFARYQLSKVASFNLNVNNVFNEDYRQYLNQSDSPGLSARIGMTVLLGR